MVKSYELALDAIALYITCQVEPVRHLESCRGGSVAGQGISFSLISGRDIYPRVLPKPLS